MCYPKKVLRLSTSFTITESGSSVFCPRAHNAEPWYDVPPIKGLNGSNPRYLALLERCICNLNLYSRATLKAVINNCTVCFGSTTLDRKHV